ncbi:MAG: PQQ-binding-like beta-propeller repeat protein [Armatimonadia bacterium]|nr:PQQ-binding-like beta-propeller repeat protein [Armatimonadia bacterium]
MDGGPRDCLYCHQGSAAALHSMVADWDLARVFRCDQPQSGSRRLRRTLERRDVRRCEVTPTAPTTITTASGERTMTPGLIRSLGLCALLLMLLGGCNEVEMPHAVGPWPQVRGGADQASCSDYLGPETVSERWRWSPKSIATQINGPAVIGEKHVLVTHGSTLRCLTEDGEEMWDWQGPAVWYGLRRAEPLLWAPVACEDGTALIVDSVGMRLLDPEGALLWTLKGADGRICLPSGGDGAYMASDSLTAFDATGETEWEHEIDGYGVGPPPAIDEKGRTLWLASKDTGTGMKLVVISSDGAILHEVDLQGRVAGPPMAVRDLAVVIDYGGSVYAIREGSIVWQRLLAGSGSPRYAACPAQQRVYMALGNTVNALASDGGTLWSVSLPGNVDYNLASDREGNLYTSVYDTITEEAVICRVSHAGVVRELFREAQAGGGSVSLGRDGRLFVGIDGWTLLCLEPTATPE